MVQKCQFSSVGSNPYFNINPGYQTVFAGIQKGEPLKLTITVLNQTKVLGGIQTRVVEERSVNAQTGDLREIAINYFAICKPTNSVFYFGENSSDYSIGKVVTHEGSWLHGSGNAHAGLVMPGIVLLGSKYYQEVAPGVALDRAEIINVNAAVKTPSGNFGNSVQVKETSGIEPNVTEYKFYASGVGLVDDQGLLLLKHGYVKVT
jgi:hypothetical protein